MADLQWPELWTEAGPETPWEPRPTVEPRWEPRDGEVQMDAVFLGRWGGYDVWTYPEGRPGLSLVEKGGWRVGFFYLMGIRPRDEGRVCVDGALAVARELGLWPERFAAGPYGPRREETTG